MANDIYPWRAGIPEEGGEPFTGAAPTGATPTGVTPGAIETGEVGPTFLTIRPTMPTAYAEPYAPPPTTVPTAPTGLVITAGTVLFTTASTATFQVTVADGRLFGGTLTSPYITGGLLPVGTTVFITGGSIRLTSPTSGTVILITGTGVRITGGFVTTGAAAPTGAGLPSPILPFFPAVPPGGFVGPAPTVTGLPAVFPILPYFPGGGGVVLLDPNNPAIGVALPVSLVLQTSNLQDSAGNAVNRLVVALWGYNWLQGDRWDSALNSLATALQRWAECTPIDDALEILATEIAPTHPQAVDLAAKLKAAASELRDIEKNNPGDKFAIGMDLANAVRDKGYSGREQPPPQAAPTTPDAGTPATPAPPGAGASGAGVQPPPTVPAGPPPTVGTPAVPGQPYVPVPRGVTPGEWSSPTFVSAWFEAHGLPWPPPTDPDLLIAWWEIFNALQVVPESVYRAWLKWVESGQFKWPPFEDVAKRHRRLVGGRNI